MWLCLRNNIEGQEQPTTSCLRIPSDSFASRPIDVAHDLADGIEVGSFVTRKADTPQPRKASLVFKLRFSQDPFLLLQSILAPGAHPQKGCSCKEHACYYTVQTAEKTNFSVPGKRAPKGLGINRIVTSFLYNHLE